MVRFRTSAVCEREAESSHFVLLREAYASRNRSSVVGLSTLSLILVDRDGGISFFRRYIDLYIELIRPGSVRAI